MHHEILIPAIGSEMRVVLERETEVLMFAADKQPASSTARSETL
jgi:hypothetical protein